MGLPDQCGAPALAGGANTTSRAEQEALLLLEEGIAFEQQGNTETALQRFDAAIALTPHLGRAHFCRGNILLDQGNAQAALDAYATALIHKPDSAAAHYNMGNACVRLGRHEDAVAAYRKAIALKADFADAQVALGGALEELGKPDDAVAHYRRALEIRPDYAEVHYNLGRALAGQGQLDDAVASYRRAIEIRPQYAEAHMNLGSVLLELGQLESAATCFQRVQEFSPDIAESYFKQGIVMQELGLLDRAATYYRRALELSPELAEAHNNLGAVLNSLGKLDDSAASYRNALAIKPELAEAHSNLGNVLKAIGLYDEAVSCFRRALELKPDFAEMHSNLGVVFLEQRQLDEAEKCFRRALETKRDYADASNNLGITLNYSGRFDEAITCFRRAIEIEADYAEAHMNLGSVMKDLGRLEESLASTRRALEINPEQNQAYNNLLFIHNYLGDQPVGQLLADARRYGEVVAGKARRYTSWPNPPEPDRCLRVGLVSGDLCNHPVGYFLVGVLEALTLQAAGRVEIFGYANRPSNDETGKRIKACCRGWHSVLGLTDEALARRIREDAIDILIDLSGHTAHSRLPVFAWKPAPVQASWLGYFATTGVAEMDYFIADPWTLPPSEEALFTEQVWRLPETRLCFTPPDAEVEVGPLPALATGHVTFGCFNNLTKMNDAVVALWARVMAGVPGSRLFLKSQQIREVSVRRSLATRFAAHGIDPGRLILEDYVPRANYLAAYQRVDIGLDPFPYPGGTTTVEALWMGVPVLTLAGERFLSRQGVGLLMNAGLPEWVASSPDDYVARAVSHASDLQRLAALRNGLRQQVLASPIFDAKRFAQHFETALRSMWREWCGKTH